MCNNLHSFTRWDRCHVQSILIEKANSLHQSFKDEFEEQGFTVIAKVPEIADLFGVNLINDDLYEIASKTEDQDTMVFYLGFDDDDAIDIQYSPDDLDSTLGGLLIVDREHWIEAYPAYDFTACDVFDILFETIIEQANQVREDRCYSALIDQTGEGLSFCFRDGFATPEDALFDAMDEFPSIVFKENDFDVINGKYQLRAGL